MRSFFSRPESEEKSGELQLDIRPTLEPNPYFSNQTITPTHIILHCSGYRDPEQTWLDNQVSTHYFIPEQNTTEETEEPEQLIVYEIVKLPLRAWHAGVSHWQNKTGFNDFAIGIEIHMPNYARALMNGTLDFKYFEPYQQAQIQTLILLVKELQKEYGIPAENVLGHSDVAAWRQRDNETVLGKTDPGPTLPWKELSELGIGQWVDDSLECSEAISQDLSARTAQKYLAEIGYAVEHTSEFDMKTNFTLGAFRLHFMPECYDPESGSAEECYGQPFDASTACAMYGVLTTQWQQQQAQRLWVPSATVNPSVHSSSLFGVGTMALNGLLLAGMCFMAGKLYAYVSCSKRSEFERIGDMEEAPLLRKHR